jgi:hypothetical protein
MPYPRVRNHVTQIMALITEVPPACHREFDFRPAPMLCDVTCSDGDENLEAQSRLGFSYPFSMRTFCATFTLRHSFLRHFLYLSGTT